MYESKVKYYYGTGRRKHSVARVRLYPGNGTITINGRGIDDYFGLDTLKLIVRQPLALTENLENMDVVCMRKTQNHAIPTTTARNESMTVSYQW